MTKLELLQKPLAIGNLTLKNRIVLSAMTRNRCINTEPNDLVVNYYKQRCGAGLLVTEGMMITPLGSEWPCAPGIWNEKQVKKWKNVTKTVHENDSLIFSQLWHIGRVAHPLHQCGMNAVAPSEIGAKGGKFRLLAGNQTYVEKPSAIEDPWKYVEMYRTAAKNALSAEFDGVEIHGANGYLPHQFLEQCSNQRTDEFGGSPEKRAKFIIEITKAAIEVFGDSKKVGVKLSPCGGYNGKLAS
jgi:2,4-dienoyl-CoA reductase-like NADH-dependent reductase (Old Yellow Enzyme family)